MLHSADDDFDTIDDNTGGPRIAAILFARGLLLVVLGVSVWWLLWA